MKTRSKHLAPGFKLCLKGPSQPMLPGHISASPPAAAPRRALQERSEHCCWLCRLLGLLPALRCWGLFLAQLCLDSSSA